MQYAFTGLHMQYGGVVQVLEMFNVRFKSLGIHTQSGGCLIEAEHGGPGYCSPAPFPEGAQGEVAPKGTQNGQ